MVVGTPAYMAPEQAKGAREEIGPSCDIYSLGVILYELLTRQLPFTGDTYSLLAKVMTEEPPPPSQHCPQVDEQLEAICLKALAKNPSDRFATMADLAAALGDYLTNSETTQAIETPIVPAAASSRWRRAVWVALAAVLLLSLGVGLILYTLHDKRDANPNALANNPAEREEGKAEPPPGDDKDEPVAYVWPAEALRDGKIRAPDLAGIKPLLQDTFKNPASGFPRGKGPLGAWGYRNGKYFIQRNDRGAHFCRIPVTAEAAAALKDSFACQIVGYTPQPHGRWGLRLAALEKADQWHFLSFSLVPRGVLRVIPRPAESQNLAEPVDARHPAINTKENVPNTLLVVLRGRHAEVYVNGVAVYDPLLLTQPISADQLYLLGSSNPNEVATAEFTSVTVWPVDMLPSLRKRGARPKP
jgi:hypothetical protein